MSIFLHFCLDHLSRTTPKSKQHGNSRSTLLNPGDCSGLGQPSSWQVTRPTRKNVLLPPLEPFHANGFSPHMDWGVDGAIELQSEAFAEQTGLVAAQDSAVVA